MPVKLTHTSFQTLTAVLTIMAGLACATTARAADTQDFLRFQRLSATKGFDGRLFAISTLDSGDLNDGLTHALPALCGQDCSKANVEEVEGGLQATTPHGSLLIMGDGACGRFQANDESSTQPVAYERRLSDERLHEIATGYVKQQLAKVVQLGPGEAIVALNVSHQMIGSQTSDERTASEFVLASDILFTRTVHGVPVFGSGSKVSVTVANDGRVVGFQYDWPRYSVDTNKTYSVFSTEELGKQLATAIAPFTPSLLGLGAWVAPSTIDWSPFARTLTSTPILPGVSLDELDCGYIDFGFARRSSGTMVLPGCTANLTFTSVQNGTDAGFQALLPATTAALSDPTWKVELASRMLPDRAIGTKRVRP